MLVKARQQPIYETLHTPKQINRYCSSIPVLAVGELLPRPKPAPRPIRQQEPDLPAHGGRSACHRADAQGAAHSRLDSPPPRPIQPLLILVRGRFRLDLSVASTTLEKEGDYAVWGPGIDHSWRAEEDSIVITVRWPSIPSS
jgi:hypothetical protein